MKAAVDKVRKSKGRTVNKRCAVMCAHFLIDADFRNVASGWVKGVVQKNVQDSRCRIWIDAAQQRSAPSSNSTPGWTTAAGPWGTRFATPSTTRSA